MLDELAEEYPEATPHIRQAINEHGKEWVLENYYQQVVPLGVVVAVPDKEELPFYDPDAHSTMTDEEKQEMAEAYSDYRDNLKSVDQGSEE